MSRLSSFKGPSTPTSTPIKPKAQPQDAPSPRSSESTYHRKVRTAMQDLQSLTDKWDGLVLVDGLRAARSLVDARTDLE